MIALACIYIASVLKDKDTTAWFEELRVDMNIVSIYFLKRTYSKEFCCLFPSYSVLFSSPNFVTCNSQVKNISMEILDFYDTYKIDPQRGIPEDKISPVMNKLPAKA